MFALQELILYPTGSEDYEAINETTIPMNLQPLYCVNVTIKDDEYFEANETFELKLTCSNPSVILQPDEIKINIVNDDGMPNC